MDPPLLFATGGIILNGMLALSWPKRSNCQGVEKKWKKEAWTCHRKCGIPSTT